MKYLSIDIETTGLNPEKHQILSIGVIVEDTARKLPFELLPKFHCAVVSDEITGGLFALNMNKDLIGLINKWNISSDEEKEKIERDCGMIFCKEDEVVEHLFNFLFKNYKFSDLPTRLANDTTRLLPREAFSVVKTTGAKINLNVAGKNFATFDKLFLERLPRWKQVFNIHQRILDPAIFFTDWQVDERLPNLSTCKQRAGLSDIITHNAVEDAFDVVQLLRTQY